MYGVYKSYDQNCIQLTINTDPTEAYSGESEENILRC